MAQATIPVDRGSPDAPAEVRAGRIAALSFCLEFWRRNGFAGVRAFSDLEQARLESRRYGVTGHGRVGRGD